MQSYKHTTLSLYNYETTVQTEKTSLQKYKLPQLAAQSDQAQKRVAEAGLRLDCSLFLQQQATTASALLLLSALATLHDSARLTNDAHELEECQFDILTRECRALQELDFELVGVGLTLFSGDLTQTYEIALVADQHDGYLLDLFSLLNPLNGVNE